VRNAIVVGKEMAKHGHRLRAVRLDSGDLLELSRLARRLLDDAGLEPVQVFASGGLDEFSVEALLAAGAPIDGFGVGTKVGVSADAPWIDCAYKLVEYDGRPVLKLSPGKATLPGPKQVYRLQAKDGAFLGDLIASMSEPPMPDAKPLLELVMKAGKRLRAAPRLAELRGNFKQEIAALPDQHKALKSPVPYPSEVTQDLERMADKVIAEVRRNERL
jgi:nicotinate phosphoribosyltransferase